MDALASLPLPLAMLVLGLMSSVHCAGMCGGIVTAFSATQPLLPRKGLAARQAAFNAGRLASYAAAGAVAGLLGSAAAYAADVHAAQRTLQLGANLLLVLVGLRLAGVPSPLAWLEALGAPAWRALQPLAARLLPSRTLPGSFAAGLAWGWLPCGLVYGALAAAALAGSPARGAAAMLGFGLGTLPALLGVGLAATRLRRWLARRPVRIAAGATVLGFGTFGLAHAGAAAAMTAHLLSH